jgi:3-isopropylmalate dehydrogenase
VLQDLWEIPFTLDYGGAIGKEAIQKEGKPLSDEVICFCQNLFSQKIPILTGPGGDRFVYDLRKHFDLFYKIVPLKDLGIRGRVLGTKDLDLLLIRENSAGVYQGTWGSSIHPVDGKIAFHQFQYTEKEVLRFLKIAVELAKQRRGRLTVVIKDSGIPSVSQLWQECTDTIARSAGIEYSFLNIDYAAYYLIQHPEQLDVIATPNLFGDILGDLGAALIGSRALTCSGNFSAEGSAIYQTNHGCAYDLVGTGSANPIGQIQSLGFLLAKSFNLPQIANAIERAILSVYAQGWRTFDLMEPGCKLVTTQEMTDLIAKALREV